MTHRDLSHYPKYSITGLSTNTILANRISFFFNLHGPSVQVDTACSSSLTGFHLGAQSLQTGESDMAIICGTALHFDPTIFVTMTDFGMLSTDGRCRHFDASASGYVRGDGICAIVLKKQRAAEMNGDNIRAIVRGTGANHDGTKEGLTLPNPKAQADLVRDVYAAGGLSPKDTGYFEAHGTGTKAGDPREALGIGSVFAADRSEPLWVGSIKPNIGHLEGASGLAGLIKSMMSVEKGKILPNMHFNTPNPDIDFEGLKIRVPQEVIDWNPENGIRRASVNSFGFGGSNAHVVLENYQKPQRQLRIPGSAASAHRPRPFLMPLSSHSENGGKLLQNAIRKYIDENRQIDARDLAHTYSTRRSLHQFRSYAVGSSLVNISKKVVNPEPEANWKRALESPKLGFVFTGQGAQWYGMGRQLIEENELFRDILSDCESILQNLPDGPSWSLLDELTRTEAESRLSESEFSQPLCTALQIALVDVLKVWGIEANGIVGHSSGEIAAAYAAGILSRSDAIICAYYRGLYMSRGKNGSPGRMMAVGLTENEAVSELEQYVGRASIAAVNSPSSITLSGDEDAILEIKKQLDDKKIFARLLQVQQAFHSHHMQPLAPAFEEALANTESFSPKPALTRMFSSVTARDSSARLMDCTYWSDNMTGRVRFSDALIGMVLNDDEEPAVDILLEVGPHPALKGPAKQTIKTLGLNLPYVASLDRKIGAYDSLMACAGQLFALGYKVNLDAVNNDYKLTANGEATCVVSGNMLTDIPTYSWDHKSFWAETRYGKEYRQRKYRHSILGAPVPGSPSTNPRWHNYIRRSELPWMVDHSIDGSVIVPGATYFAIAVEALIQTASAQQIKDIVLSNVSIKAALTIPDSDIGIETMLDLSLQEDLSSALLRTYKFEIYSFTEDGETVHNCSGTIAAVSGDTIELTSAHTFEEYQLQTVQNRPAKRFYERLSQVGLHYGETFRLVSDAFESAPGFAVAPLVYDPSKTFTTEADACVIHPTLVDSAFHVIFAALESQLDRALDDTYVPTFCKELRVSASMIARKNETAVQKYWVSAKTDVLSSRLNSSNVIIHESGSKIRLVELQGLQLTALGLSYGKENSRPVFFRIEWKPAFEFLGFNAVEPNFSELDDLLACYSHQHPENEILSISSQSQTIEEGSKFDLVIVDVESYDGVSDLLKPNGFVVSTKHQFIPNGLQTRFSHGSLKISQAPVHNVWPEHITLILGSSPSKDTLSLARQIQQKASSSKVSTTAWNKFDDSLARDALISLVGLDEDIFSLAGSRTEEQFETLKKVLCMPSANLVWLHHSIDEEMAAPSQSLISGLARSARSENDSLRLVTLELPQNYLNRHVCAWIHQTYASNSQEDEYAIKDGHVSIPRVISDRKLNAHLSGAGAPEDNQFLAFEDHHLRLMDSPFAATPGSVVFEKQAISAPLAGDEVEIAVQASSLTREDTLPSCVGTVINTGPNSELRKGAKVFALSPNKSAHASIIRTKTSLVQVLKATDPDVMNLAAYVGVPLLNVMYAVHELARIQDGDVCLVHDASNITGQVAVSILQSVGARVIATVRKDADRQYLHDAYGLQAEFSLVMGCGDLRELVNEVSRSQGCRMVLNCGTVSVKEVLPSFLSTTGHLIEFSSSPEKISQGGCNATNTRVNLAAIIDADSHLAQKLLKQTFQILEEGEVSLPIIVRKFSYSRLSEAFQSFQTDSTLERALLYAEDLVAVRNSPSGLPKLFHADKTYLIVGGLGGIGRVLVQWMFRKGARKFAFLARSGATKADAKETVEWLQLRDAEVTVHSGNVSDEMTVRNWVESIQGDLGGVFQGATVLNSGSLSDMTAKTWQTVLDPKVKGSLNLHHATLGHSLDFFLCFSSILAIIGFPSEANYSAANGFMDHFITWRHKQNLPGASMNIGVVADAGLVAESEGMKAGMQRMRMDTISEDELFFQFEHAILSQYPAQDANGIIDHQILSGINVSSRDPFWSSKPLFRRLYANVTADGAAAGSGANKDLKSLLRAAESPEKMNEILAKAFVEKVSSSLSIASADIHIGLPLASYGMDSLVAVDFRNWFSKEVGVDLALFDIIGSKTTALLIQSICGIFANQQTAQPDPTGSSHDKAENQIVSRNSSDTLISGMRPKHLPLSSFQTRLWFMDNVMEHDGGLTIGMTLMIKGEPQFNHINSSFHEMARRNEMLRTRYFEGDDFAEQEVLPSVSCNVQYVDISKQSAPFDMVQSQIDDLTSVAMDLEKGEVYRSRLVKLGEAQYVWLFAIHHIAIDGGSRESFMEQIVSCYNDATGGKSSASTPKSSYIDFTLWHEGVLKSSEVQSDLTWWKQHLAGASPTSNLLPFAKQERPDKASDDRRTIRSHIAKVTLKRMKRICSNVNVTPFHFILAALRAFVYRYTTEEDLNLLVINGERPHPSFEGIIGFFVNVIPLRWKSSCEDSFESLLMEAKTLAMESMAHSRAPFDAIVDSLEMGWNPQHFPLGQIALNYQMYAKSPKYTTADFEILDVHVTDVPTACELQFEVMENPETGLGFTLDYDSYLYGAPEMDRFLENFMTFIESAVQDFRQPVEEVEMCGRQEYDFLRANCWAEEPSTLPWMKTPMWERFMEVTRQPTTSTRDQDIGRAIDYI